MMTRKRFVLTLGLLGAWHGPLARSASANDFPRFEAQTIDRKAGEVCYALAAADVDGDGKRDIVAALDDAIVWYANPSWERRTISSGKTLPDNVCLEVGDLDRDGRIDLVVGAGWGPLGLRGTETLQWLGRDRGTESWSVHPIASVPSLHRVRMADVLGTGRPQIFAAPLQGQGVKEPDWGQGPGVRVLMYPVPDDPVNGEWKAEMLDQGLHTVHGLQVADCDGDGEAEVMLAAWEGVYALNRRGKGDWVLRQLAEGDQRIQPSRGASEVSVGRLAGGRRFVATVEPWHGEQVVLYTRPPISQPNWVRHRIAVASGAHALQCVDLDGDGLDEVVVARRDADHNLQTKPNDMGVSLYQIREEPAGRFDVTRHVVDDGGIAAEDLIATDLDGDGRIDLVAGGRETHNIKIYWNREARP